jgi:hypothetical protein
VHIARETRDVPAKLGQRAGQREEGGMRGEQDDIVTDRIEKNDRGTRWETFYGGNTKLNRLVSVRGTNWDK